MNFGQTSWDQVLSENLAIPNKARGWNCFKTSLCLTYWQLTLLTANALSASFLSFLVNLYVNCITRIYVFSFDFSSACQLCSIDFVAIQLYIWLFLYPGYICMYSPIMNYLAALEHALGGFQLFLMIL
jgi:hypothetical protein